MKTVTVIYKSLPRYRKDFFNGLRHALLQNGIELRLLYGQPSRKNALKNDTVDLDWAIRVPSKIWEMGRYEIYWQPVLPYLKDADLVIVEQASKLLVNYVLLLQNALGIRKLAFWGHGKNMQTTSANPLAEWVKRQVSTHVHWWFAYNEMSARIVREMGFPAERITCVQNAVDTKKMLQSFQTVSPEVISKTRTELNLYSSHVGIYAGSMYPEKRLPFLLEALHQIRKNVPDFEMIFIGNGADARLVKQQSEKHPWIHYLGTKFDDEKIPFFTISTVSLMPGAVGLGVLDTFVLETPLITTNVSLHGPEIEYLKDGINGIMVYEADNPQKYADAVVEVLTNVDLRKNLVYGCKIAREQYTVENMVSKFTQGILMALEH